MSEELLVEAHHFLDWARGEGADLDGTDESVFFLEGVLQSMAAAIDEDPALRSLKVLSYAVYLAETLAASCPGVTCVVEGEGYKLHDVYAIHDSGVTQYTLNWIYDCLYGFTPGDLSFKYAGALRDFGHPARAEHLITVITTGA